MVNLRANNIIAEGNLTVNGTTTTVNSTTVTVQDPIITLGSDITNNKDKGIEFKYGDSKIGFFGYDNSAGNFVFLKDVSNNSEVFSGTQGTIEGAIFKSSVGSGTAPLTVASSTLVTNLNADLLDGLDSTKFMRTDIDSSTTGYITGKYFISTVTTAGPPLVVASSLKVNNLNADLLDGLDSTKFMRTDISTSTTGNIGIGTATPQQQLHVNGNILCDDSLLFSHNGSASLPLLSTTLSPTTGIYINESTFGITTNGTSAVTFDQSGNTNIVGVLAVGDAIPGESTALGITKTYDATTTRYGILETIILNDANVIGNTAQYGTRINLTNYQDEINDNVAIGNILSIGVVSQTATITLSSSVSWLEQSITTTITSSSNNRRLYISNATDYNVGDIITISNSGGNIDGNRTLNGVTSTYIQFDLASATWTNTTSTIVVARDLRLMISGVTPTTNNLGVDNTGFNGAWTARRTGNTTFTITVIGTPASYVSGGSVYKANRTTQTIYGEYTLCDNGSSTIPASATTMYGSYVVARNLAASPISNTINSLFGSRSDVQNSSTGLVTNAYGHFAQVTQSNIGGQTTNAYGYYSKINPDNGRITNSYLGYFWSEMDGGIVDNTYGIYVRLDRDGGTATNGTIFHGQFEGTWDASGTRIGLYLLGSVNSFIKCESATGVSQFEVTGTGNVGIGKTNPIQQLDVSGNILISGNIGIGIADPQAKLHVNGIIMVGNRPLMTWWTTWIQKSFNLGANVFYEMNWPCRPGNEGDNQRVYRMPVNCAISGCVIGIDSDAETGTFRVRVYTGTYQTLVLDQTTESSSAEASIRMYFTTPYNVSENTNISLQVSQTTTGREFTVQLFGYQYA